MKPVIRLASVAALILVSAAAEAAETLRFGHVYTTDRRDHQCALAAADALRTRTDGRYDVQVYPNSELGDEGSLHQQLSLGSVDLAITSSPFASSAYPPIGVESAPFVFRDYDHWQKYGDSEIYDRLTRGYNEATGNKILSTHYQGAWHVLSDEPITRPEDMAGLKMRVPNAPTWLAFPRAVGATPAPIAYSEAYLALQQNVVDIMDQGLAGIATMKFHEVRDTVNMTGHLTISAHTIIGAPLWNRLPEEDRDIFTDVFSKAAAECSEQVRADESEIQKSLANDGVQFVEVDRPAFVEKIAEFAASNDLGWKTEDYEALQALD